MRTRNVLFVGIILLCVLFAVVYLLTKSAKYKESRAAIKEVAVVEQKSSKAPEATQKFIPQESVTAVKPIAQDEAIKAFIKNLESKDWPTAQKAAEDLAKLGKLAVPDLIEALKDASVGLKGQVVFLLGRIGDKQAVSSLTQALKDDNAYIKANSAEALGKIKDETALSNLTTSLFDDDYLVRERSARAIGEINSPNGVEDLINRMADEKDERVKSGVVAAFAKIKDQRATPVLLTELSSVADETYKDQVVFSLGEIGDPRALEGLKQHLDYLKQHEPKDPMARFPWEQAVKITEEAIQKIEKKQ